MQKTEEKKNTLYVYAVPVTIFERFKIEVPERFVHKSVPADLFTFTK